MVRMLQSGQRPVSEPTANVSAQPQATPAMTASAKVPSAVGAAVGGVLMHAGKLHLLEQTSRLGSTLSRGQGMIRRHLHHSRVMLPTQAVKALATGQSLCKAVGL